MDTLAKGWFTEFSPDDLAKFRAQQEGTKPDDKSFKSEDGAMGQAWPGQAFSLQVNKVLVHQHSRYQDILVFESETYGKVLVLDGIIQCTERDEFSYQEMLAHLPMCCHPDPKEVLIIGGGDGGILREVLKHECVQSVTMCEIDQLVIDVSKKHLPGMAACFDDPKLKLHVGDGFAFLKKHPNQFDVIITDSSDPIGPAESLFGESYYKKLKNSLTHNGVLSSQAESLWLHFDLIQHMVTFCKSLFPRVAYANGLVPTYPSGSIGYLICSKDEDCDITKPTRVLSAEQIEKMKLRYYNSAVHQAAFVLPQFAAQALEQ